MRYAALLALLLIACDPSPHAYDGGADAGTVEADGCVAAEWCQDHDGDGFPTAFACIEACTQPAGYLPAAGEPGTPYWDCESRDDTSFPGAEERCDHTDNDCDGQTDEGEPTGAEEYCDAEGRRLGTFCSSRRPPGSSVCG